MHTQMHEIPVSNSHFSQNTVEHYAHSYIIHQHYRTPDKYDLSLRFNVHIYVHVSYYVH